MESAAPASLQIQAYIHTYTNVYTQCTYTPILTHAHSHIHTGTQTNTNVKIA